MPNTTIILLPRDELSRASAWIVEEFCNRFLDGWMDGLIDEWMVVILCLQLLRVAGLHILQGMLACCGGFWIVLALYLLRVLFSPT